MIKRVMNVRIVNKRTVLRNLRNMAQSAIRGNVKEGHMATMSQNRQLVTAIKATSN